MLDYPHAHLTAADRMVLNQWLPFMMEAAKEAERLRQDAGFYHAGTHALSAENYRLRARVEELEAALEHVMAECEDAHAGAGDKWDEHTTRLFSDTLMAIRRDAEEALAHARKEK